LGALAAGAFFAKKKLLGMASGAVLSGLGKLKKGLSGLMFSKSGSVADSVQSAISGDQSLSAMDGKKKSVAKGKKSKSGGGKRGKSPLGFVERMDPKKMLAGAAAMVIVAGALYITAQALVVFNDVDWGSLVKAGVALLGLTLALSAIGSIMLSGVGAVAIIAGAAAMVIMAGGIWVLGKAMQEFGDPKAIAAFNAIFDGIGGIILDIGTAISNVIISIAAGITTIINSIFEGFTSMSTLGPGLLLASTGIAAVAGSLALFGGGSILSGIGSFIGGLFGGDQIEKFKQLSDLAPGLTATAMAFKMMSSEMAILEPMLARLSPMTESIVKLGSAFSELGWGLTKMAGGALLLSPFLPVLDKLTNIKPATTTVKKQDNNDIAQSTDMTETNKLLKELIGYNKLILEDQRLGLGKLTTKVGELGVSG